jgi:hypothetical protein
MAKTVSYELAREASSNLNRNNVFAAYSALYKSFLATRTFILGWNATEGRINHLVAVLTSREY